MGQGEVLSILEKQNKPLSRTEIANILQEPPEIISHLIKKLIKGDYIKIIEIDRVQAMKLYHSKRRMRLYYSS